MEHILSLKFSGNTPINNRMTISNGPTSLVDSVLDAQTTQQEIGVSVLKKAQAAMKQQGQAIIQMLEEAGAQAPQSGQPLLDTYA